jgi:hypothetical protein
MLASDAENRAKKPYTTPRLTLHGTLTDITLMRFNWHPRRPGDWTEDDAVDSVS